MKEELLGYLWADGTYQSIEDDEPLYEWMSDDYLRIYNTTTLDMLCAVLGESMGRAMYKFITTGE